MKLITETLQSNISVLTEGAGSDKKTFIEGVMLQAEKPNRNHRIYRRHILESAVNKYIKEQVSTGRAVGELNHPEGPTVNLDKVSHRITQLRWDGDNVVGKALILNTPMGQIVKGLLEGGVQLGVSSRGMGSLERKGDIHEVKDDFMLATIDIVQDPSAPEAFVNGIMEGVEYFMDGDKLVAKRVDEMIDNLENIKKMKSAQYFTEARLQAFKEFLDTV